MSETIRVGEYLLHLHPQMNGIHVSLHHQGAGPLALGEELLRIRLRDDGIQALKRVIGTVDALRQEKPLDWNDS